MGLELLGAEEPSRAILLRVKNARVLAAKEGGAPGAIAATVVPETIEGVVLQKIGDELDKNLRAKGVDAEVRIVSASGQPVAKSGFGEGIFVGLAVCAASLAAWRFGLKRFL